MDFFIDDVAKKFLLALARDVVAGRFSGKNSELDDVPTGLDFKSGCFVTLHKRGRLRGCIGNFRDDVDIVTNIGEMAAQAAFHDPRFPELSEKELDEIDFEISVLSPMIPVEGFDEIVIGRDGLYVIKGFNRGVLLPQVATENGWDKETFLSQTCVKAGLSADTWQKEEIKLLRFEASVFGEKEFLQDNDLDF